MGLIVRKPFAVQFPRMRPRRRVEVETPHLSVVVVNYHQWENTAQLVRQLRISRTMQRQTGEVLVMDNHSPKHPVVPRLRRMPGVSLCRWGRNRGFARAVNEGCRLSQGEWILLLNPDMTLPPGFLDQVHALTERLSTNESRVGIVGLGLRNADDTPQHSAGFFPTFWSTLTRLLLPRTRRKYEALPQDRPRSVDWVTGCAMLIRRQCFQELGGLDTDFFLYYEDVDLCRRARRQGWSVWYEPTIQAIHHNPLHCRKVPPALRVVTRHSLLTYALKHWPRWQFRLLAKITHAEAKVRRLRARVRGQSRAAAVFAEMGRVIHDIAGGAEKKARKRILRLARRRQFYEES